MVATTVHEKITVETNGNGQAVLKGRGMEQRSPVLISGPFEITAVNDDGTRVALVTPRHALHIFEWTNKGWVQVLMRSRFSGPASRLEWNEKSNVPELIMQLANGQQYQALPGEHGWYIPSLE